MPLFIVDRCTAVDDLMKKIVVFDFVVVLNINLRLVR